MAAQWVSLQITRAGEPLEGSPFAIKLRYRRLHVDPQIAPIASRRPVQEFLIFQNIAAAVEVGDIVTLPDGSVAKIIDVRSYAHSLQCILQRLPYASLPIWTPSPLTSQIGADKSLADPVYISAGTVLALVEPHGIDQGGPLPVGRADRRSSWVFSEQQLTVQTVIAVNGDYWMLTATSSYWAISNDYRAPARRLTRSPLLSNS